MPQASLKKPVPPPKPGHLKVARASSNQEIGVARIQSEKTRNYSDADAQGRAPPPNVPPPVYHYLIHIKVFSKNSQNSQLEIVLHVKAMQSNSEA